MKHSILPLFLLAPAPLAQSPPPEVLHVQARLADAVGSPLSGPVQLTFRLHDASSGGSELWSETRSAVALDGLVELDLGELAVFPSGLFDGSARWLGLEVGGDGEMVPRLPLVSTPFALHAGTVASIGAGTQIEAGVIDVTHLVDGAVTSTKLAAGSVGTAALFDGSISTTKLLNGAVTGAKIADGTVTDADVSAGAAIAGTKVVPHFGAQDIFTDGRVGVGTEAPLGRLEVQSALEAAGWFESGESHGAMGIAHAGSAFPWPLPYAGVYGFNDGGGDGVQGVTGMGGAAGVRGYTSQIDSYGGWFENDGNGVSLHVRGWGQTASRAALRVENMEADAGMAGYLTNDSNFATVHVENDGPGQALWVVGSGKGASNAALRVISEQPEQGMATYLTNQSDFATAHLQNDGSGEVLWLDNRGQGNYVVAVDGNTGQWNFWVDENGKTSTRVLQILGGADLSERFDVRAEDERAPEPGTVVCIDPEAPGELVVSSRAYDRTVAGVISGAGGVRTGMLMGQEGSVADGEHPVALTGRVYVRADTSHGPIRPGDLLTTSERPGHAAAVADASRAPGAVLGKAMTGLDEGTGLVLVLVSLQ